MKMMQWTVCAGLLILISGAWAQDAQEKGKPPVLQERKEQGDRTQVAKAELEALRADIEQSMKREARLRKMIAAARQLSDGEQYFTPQVLEDLVKVCGGGVTLKSYQMRTKWGYPITKRNSSLGPKPDTQSPMVRRVTIHFSGTVGTEEQLRKFEKRLEKTNLLSSIELDYFWRPKDPKKPSSFYIHCRVRPDAKLFEPLAKFVLSNLPQPKPLPPKLGPAKNSTNVSKAKLDQSIALAKRDKAAAAAKADSASAQMDAILKADAGETDKVDLQVAIGEIRALAAESKLECVLKTRNGGPHPLVGTKAYKAYSLTIQAQGRYEGYRAFLSKLPKLGYRIWIPAASVSFGTDSVVGGSSRRSMQKVNLGIQILLPATATKIPKVRIGGKPCNKSAVPATPTTAPKPTVLKPAPTKP